MTKHSLPPGRRALVISDSMVFKDPRVLNQIRWLVGAGWLVDTLGVGGRPAEVNGEHFELGKRPLPLRVASYLVLPPRARFRFGTSSMLPDGFTERLADYDLIVVNETELLPWLAPALRPYTAAGRAPLVHLDLHEFSFSESTDLSYRVLFARYRRWLASFIADPVFNSRSTVAIGIADLYRSTLDIPQPNVIMSCPLLVAQEPSPVTPEHITLVHHGNADLDKGIGLIIEALPTVDRRYQLELMLVGSDQKMAHIRGLIDAAGVSDRVTLRTPVPVSEVSRAIHNCDLEVIIFTPKNENLRMALPNKFFEAVQGRLGVITGQSPSMVALSDRYGFGVAIDDWTAQSLARTLNSLTAEDIVRMKSAAHAAAADLNAAAVGEQFLTMIAALDATDGTEPA